MVLDDKKRYFYSSFQYSVINSLLLSLLCIPAANQCSPPPEHRQDNLWLGNTYLRNQWCVDNPNIYEYLLTVMLCAYLFVDLYVQFCLQKDWRSSTARINIFHHTISIIMGLGSLPLNNYLNPTGAICLLTELSTPMSNLRWFLVKHQKTDTLLYKANQFIFKVTFFLCRNCF